MQRIRIRKPSRAWSRTVAVLGAGLAAFTVAPPAVHAHGFGQRYDLPVPLWLYLAGAGLAVALSFALAVVFVKHSSPTCAAPAGLPVLRWRAGGRSPIALLIPVLRSGGVAALALVVVAGLAGNQRAGHNLAPVLVWVIWWVGVAYCSVLAGDVWRVLNPWDSLFRWVEALYARVRGGGSLSLRLPYSERVGVWPAFALFLVFAWVETVYENAAVPAELAQMALFYTYLTLGGMFLFGREAWLRHGEVFSIVFGIFARLAPSEVRPVGAHRELRLRLPGAGLLSDHPVSPSMTALVLLILTTVTFEGFTGTPVWARLSTAVYGPAAATGLLETLGLGAAFLLFLGIYLGFCRVMAAVAGPGVSTGRIARSFVLSLVPIAAGYHLAHFLTFLIVQGQLVIPLVSDPLGIGWDLFGTSAYRFNAQLVDASFSWFTALAAIIAGHVIAVLLAHLLAMGAELGRGAVLRTQFPMLLLMLLYTVGSLWILAQPIVTTGGEA